jgi:hypothetical protein
MCCGKLLKKIYPQTARKEYPIMFHSSMTGKAFVLLGLNHPERGNEGVLFGFWYGKKLKISTIISCRAPLSRYFIKFITAWKTLENGLS